MLSFLTWAGTLIISQSPEQVRIEDLRPTQAVVGYLEVKRKIKEHEKDSKAELERYRIEKTVPVVRGPDKNLYMIDHHHSTLALYELGVKKVYVNVIADLSHLPNMESFWNEMKSRHWCYLKDEKGRELKPSDLPKKLWKLRDDPYRALAGMVRDMGGFSKTGKPFEEFVWADKFREWNLLPKKPKNGECRRAAEKAIAMLRGRHTKIEFVK